jgi:excisionase family DNA binding protein
VNDPLVTADEVAKMLNVPKSWVYAEARRGNLPSVPLGRYRRYRPEAIEQWVKERESRDGRP